MVTPELRAAIREKTMALWSAEDMLALLEWGEALEAELADARFALAVHSGVRELWGLSDDEKAAMTRALAELHEHVAALEGPLVEIGDPLFNEDGTPWKPIETNG